MLLGLAVVGHLTVGTFVSGEFSMTLSSFSEFSRGMNAPAHTW
jgi:hypothetical protein